MTTGSERRTCSRSSGWAIASTTFPDAYREARRNRVSAAIALANRPDLLLADEVTGQLDSANAEVVMSVVFDAWRLRGLTVVFVTHNHDSPSAALPRPGGRRGARAVSGGAGVRLDDVTKHYESDAGLVPAVEGISLDVRPGTSLAITRAERLRQVHPARPDRRPRCSHRRPVSIGGRDISMLPEQDRAHVRRHEIGLVLQSDNLLPFLTAAENVSLRLAA